MVQIEIADDHEFCRRVRGVELLKVVTKSWDGIEGDRRVVDVDKKDFGCVLSGDDFDGGDVTGVVRRGDDLIG